MHIWLWLCILVEFCRIWIASSLLVSFMQCKLVYKSIICSIRFFDFNFQGAIGEWRFLDFYSVFLQVRVCQVFICFVFLIFTEEGSRAAMPIPVGPAGPAHKEYQNRSENRHSKNIQNASEVKKNS